MNTLPEDLDNALAGLQESLGDAATLTNIVISLRANSTRLLDPLRSTLEDLRDALNAALAQLP